MTYRLNGSDGVEFAISDSTQQFEFVYDPEALRAFIRLANKALAELDPWYEQEHDRLETTAP